MVIRRQAIKAFRFACRCERCGHVWKTIGETPPVRCPKCKARHWDRPALWKRA